MGRAELGNSSAFLFVGWRFKSNYFLFAFLRYTCYAWTNHLLGCIKVGILRWIKSRLGHKLDHFRWSHIKRTLKEHGLALVVILLVWEIIEDVCFPIAFIWLGTHVHPAFLAGAPASWLLCLHWLVVPITWSAWMKLSGRKKWNCWEP